MATALGIEQCHSLAELLRVLLALKQPAAKPTPYRWSSK
jgi:hypothetical protein